MVRGDDRDRDMHDDPHDHGKEQGHERRLVAAPAEIRPYQSEDHTPDEAEKEVNSRAENVGEGPEQFLDLLPKDQARRVTRNAR